MMKQYTSCATKWLALLTIISVATLIAGIICILAHSSNIGLQIGLTMLGALMSILFISCFFAEKSRCLIMDNEKIILPKGADKNGKISFHKTVINLDEIHSIRSVLNKGDGIISENCLFHTIKLNDGTTIKFTLYAYGKNAEAEILKNIKKHLRMTKATGNLSVVAAHQYCTANKEMLRKDNLCGCFYCLKIFSPKQIEDWIIDKNGPTAQCPCCGIDSVIGESSGYPITEDFLKKMNEYWF